MNGNEENADSIGCEESADGIELGGKDLEDDEEKENWPKAVRMYAPSRCAGRHGFRRV